MSRYPYETAPIYPAGTVLQVRAHGLIDHVGIATGYGTVIHSSRRFGAVAETSLDQFSQGRPVAIVPCVMPLPGSEVVARARGRIGQRYGVLTRNCEHFVHWAISGQPKSRQLGPFDLGRSSR